jgi:tetratricopeptide (TPR) repeat protein
MEKQKLNFGIFKKEPLCNEFFLPINILFVIAFILFHGCATQAAISTKQIIDGNRAALSGNYSASVSNYENALKNVPDSPAAKRNLGIVLVKVGNFKKAKLQLEEVKPLYPSDSELLYFLGEACRGVEDFKCAIENYQSVIRKNTKDVKAKKALAWTYQKIGEFEKSLALVKQILSTKQDDIQGRLIAATVYNRQKLYAKARDTLLPIEKNQFNLSSGDNISAESERALLMNASADAYFGLGQTEKSLQLYSSVLKTRPFLSNALLGAAKCEVKLGQKDRALAKLERATKSDPNNKEAYWLLAKLLENYDTTKSAYFYKRFLLLAKEDPKSENQSNEARRVLKSLSH